MVRNRNEASEGAKGIKPKIKLTGEDGNAIIGRCCNALRRAGYSYDDIQKFTDEAMSGDYDKVLQTAMKWLDVS